MLNFFKKVKEKYIRFRNIESVLDLTYNYKHVVLDNPIIVAGTIFLVKDKDRDLYFFVKKENWKKYIGIKRTYLSDSQGNDFSADSFYKAKDLDSIIWCNSIPENLLEETMDELIKYKKDIEDILKEKIQEEFYK